MKKHLFMIIALIGLVTGISVAQEEYITVKICSLHPKPIVKAELNGKPAYFLLDTGSDINMVNSRLAKKYGFKTMRRRNNRHLLSTINGLNADFTHVYNMDMSMSGVKIAAVFLSLDIEPITNSLKQKSGLRIAGILGSQTMKTHCFVIDYEKEKITIKGTKLR